jgi:TP901 family phage tail tape measure protein
MGSSLGNIGRQAQSAGLGLTFFATVPIVTAFVGAVKAASSFEDELIKLNTLSGLTQTEIEGIRQGILSLAPALGKVPTELAEAAFFITSTGDLRDAASALEVLEISAKASAIGLGETKVVAGAVTSVLAAYGFEASEAGRVTDTLTAAVDRGKFETEQFAPAIGKVLGLAAEMGVSFEEASNFIATYTLSGQTASQATTSLLRTLVSIQKPTQAARDALAEVGISLEDIQAAVQEKGLTATLLELRKQFDDAGISLGEFFTRVTGLNGVLFNTGEASALFVSNMQAINASAGIVERGFATVQQSTSFQLAQLKASFSVLGTTIGSVLLPAINSAISRIIPFVIAISDFAAQNPKLVLIASAFALITATLGPLLLVVGFTIVTFTSLVGIIGTLVGAAFTLIPPVALIGAAFLSLGAIIAAVVQHRFKEANMTFGQFAANALNWGKNITINLARGLIAGAIAVVQALNQIGQVISSWLAPGSPPKLLPDLPEWGASAMNEWLQGFTSADFSVFNTLAGTVEQFMRALAPDDDITLVPNILGIREILAQAITEVNNLAVVNDATVAAIVAGYGVASGAAQDYIVTMLRLAEAQEDVLEIQEEINDVNAQFDANIGPLQDELDAIEARRQEVKDQQRIEELQGILDDENAPALAHELALMELREIELRRQIAAEEEARDAALEALETELAAAEAEAAALAERAAQQEALIQAQITQNELMEEQIELLRRLADEIANIGDIGGGGGIGDVGGITPIDGGSFAPIDIPPLELDDLLGEGFTSLAEGIKTSITDLVEEIVGELSGPLSTLGAAWEELGATWSETWDNIVASWNENIKPVFDYIIDNKDTIISGILGIGAAFLTFKTLTFLVAIGTAMSGVISAITAIAAGGGIAGLIYGLAGAFDAAVVAVGALVAAIGGPVTLVIAAIALAVGLFVVAWRENWFDIQGRVATFVEWWKGTAWPAITGALQSAWDFIVGIWTSIRDWVTNTLVPKIQELAAVWAEKWETIKLGLSNAWSIIVTIWQEVGRWINHNIIPWVNFLASLWAEKWKAIAKNLGLAWDVIKTIWELTVKTIKENLTESITTFKETWNTMWGLIQVGFMIVWAVIEPIWNTIRDWFEATFPGGLDILKAAWDNTFSTLGAPVEAVKGFVEGLFNAAREFWDWVTSHDFSFSISIPDLPAWAIPDSPLPIHTAWENFAKAMSGRSIELAFTPVPDVQAQQIAMPAHIAAAQAGGSQSNTIGPNYISNGMDEAVFAERVRRVVTGGL